MTFSLRIKLNSPSFPNSQILQMRPKFLPITQSLQESYKFVQEFCKFVTMSNISYKILQEVL